MKSLLNDARRRSGVIFVFAILLSACAATPQADRLLSAGLDFHPRQFELYEYPFFPQTQYFCGPASLAAMLRGQGIDVTPDALAERVYLPARRGSLQLEMVAAARGFGMLAYPLAPELNAIMAEVRAGNAVLVLQNLAFSWRPQWHYALVVGYDLDNAQFVLRSGTQKRLLETMRLFERTWQRSGHWGYVIVKPGKIPATAVPDAYLFSSNALGELGFKGEALIALRSGADRWPENYLIQMAVGNAEFDAGSYMKAYTAFSRAIAVNKENADAWNNLAYALAYMGCRQESSQALQCAVSLRPEDDNIRSSAIELNQLTGDVVCRHTLPTCP